MKGDNGAVRKGVFAPCWDPRDVALQKAERDGREVQGKGNGNGNGNGAFG